MKKIILFLSIIAISQTVLSQKKDKFSIYDLDKTFRFIDSVNRGMNADVITAHIVKSYNLKEPHKAQHPGKGAEYAVYEFHFADNSRLYLLVRSDLIVADITHKYDYTDRGSNFMSWDIGSGKINVGKHTK